MDNYIRADGKIQIIRWGEVHLALIKKLPTGLKKAKTDVVMTGSSNNPHIVKNCDIYFKKESDFVFGYLRARKGAKLYHAEHGSKKVGGLMEAKLKVGNYQLRVQNEATHEGLKIVED